MRLVFAGTPEFAERALDALHGAGYEIALVLTQPDRPSGRGLHPASSAVKRFALAHGLTLYQPATLRAPEAQARLREVGAQAMVVAAYGLIVPRALLEAFAMGAFNIHASLLPRWRGAAPIQRALLAGDRETGISIMKMDEGLDTGPVLAQERLAIDPTDDAGSLHDRLAALGAKMMVAALEDIAAGAVQAVPQPEMGVTYAHKIGKEESLLDWDRPAAELERAVRAFRPFPGASTRLEGEPLKIWRAHIAEEQGAPGVLLRLAGDALVIGCAEGALAVTELQRSGGRRLSAPEFMRGRPIAPGTRLG